jgi:hypothetical protein
MSKAEVFMKNKVLRTLWIALTCAALVGSVALAYVFSYRADIGDQPINVIPVGNRIAVISDKLSQNDMDGLMDIIIGKDGSFVDDYQRLRQKYVFEMDRFQILTQDGKLVDAEANPLTVKLHNGSEGYFEYTFYVVVADDRSLVVPSEQDAMPFLFLVSKDAESFFACTDTGIYAIDSASQSAQLISSTLYKGETYEDLSRKYIESGGWYLSWIGNPVLSPDGQWIAFQSNRNDADSLPSSRESLWILDTQTGEERMIPQNGELSQVPQGFIAQNILLVANSGAQENDGTPYSLVDVLTGHDVQLDFGNIPNAYLDDISSVGCVAFQSYDDTGECEIIFEISKDGECQILAEISGHLQYVKFSPDGSRIAAVLRGDSGNDVIDTVLLIDTSTGKVTSIDNVVKGSYVSGLAWVNDGQFAVTENLASNGKIYENSYLYTTRSPRASRKDLSKSSARLAETGRRRSGR